MLLIIGMCILGRFFLVWNLKFGIVVLGRLFRGRVVWSREVIFLGLGLR